MDDVFFPEVLGYDEGNVIPVVYLRHSEAVDPVSLVPVPKGDRLQFTFVESVRKEYDAAGDVIRVSISLKSGILTKNVVIPF